MHWLQHHWYRITPLHLVLLPISLLFGMLSALRRSLYRLRILPSYSLPVPVIVVGNISVGGTGKTPLTLELARQLIAKGRRPIIVSRGYLSETPQPRQVDPGTTAQLVGDEPLLMSKRMICPVWVGKDRVATARLALEYHPDCDTILCDDGLQHYRLRRNVEIAVTDGMLGVGNGFLLPAGPLREPVSRLRTVDAVVVNGGETDSNQYSMRLDGSVFYNLLDPGKSATADAFSTSLNHAVAGIGHPQRFFQHLSTLGISFTSHAFPDHHPYSASDLSFDKCNTVLLTEKDAVKCVAFADARYWVLRVDAQIDSALTGLILRKINSHGCQTA